MLSRALLRACGIQTDLVMPARNTSCTEALYPTCQDRAKLRLSSSLLAGQSSVNDTWRKGIAKDPVHTPGSFTRIAWWSSEKSGDRSHWSE